MIVDRFQAPVPWNSPHDITCVPVHRDCREMCVIRLHDAWARFCRQLIIISAGGTPQTMGGSILLLAPGISKPSEVIPKLLSTRPRRKNFERRWHDPASCIDAAKRLGIQNLAEVSAGIGASPSPLEDIRKMRNFLAHRGLETASDVRQVAQRLGFRATAKVEQIVSNRVSPGPTVFEMWVAQLQAMAWAAVQ